MTHARVVGWWGDWKLNRRSKRPKHRQRTRREQRALWDRLAYARAHYTPLPFMIETITFGGGVTPHSQAQDGMFVLTIGDITYTPNTFTAGHARP